MPTNFKVTAFNINRCGYYRRSASAPEFGSLFEVLTDLVVWTQDKDMSETLTFTSDDEDTLSAYCFDIRTSPRNGDFLLTTWNEVPMVEGGVQTASGATRVGHVEVELAEVANGNIPGFPSYFYFMSNENLVFSFRPEGQPHNGHKSLVKFLHGFIARASSFVVINPDAQDVDNHILGYRPQGNTGEPRQLIASYASSPKHLPGSIDFLRSNCDRIRKLVRQDTLNISVQADRNLAGKLLENVGLLSRQITVQNMSFKYEMDFSPSLEDFNQILDTQHHATDKSDIGFKLVGEGSEIHWLSHSLARSDIELNISPNNTGVLSAPELLNELHRTAINRMLEIAQLERVNNPT